MEQRLNDEEAETRIGVLSKAQLSVFFVIVI
jgi:hypothetical protein